VVVHLEALKGRVVGRYRFDSISQASPVQDERET